MSPVTCVFCLFFLVVTVTAPPTTPINCEKIDQKLTPGVVIENCDSSVTCEAGYILDLTGIDEKHHFIHSVKYLNCAILLFSDGPKNYSFEGLLEWRFTGMATVSGSVTTVAFPKLQRIIGGTVLLGPSEELTKVSFSDHTKITLDKVFLCNATNFKENSLPIESSRIIRECLSNDFLDEKKDDTHFPIKWVIISVGSLLLIVLVAMIIVFRIKMLNMVIVLIYRIRKGISWVASSCQRREEAVERLRQSIRGLINKPFLHSNRTHIPMSSLTGGTESLGAGAFGKVVLVNCRKYGPAAAKIFKSYPNRPEIGERNKREIEIGFLARGHENILRTIAVLYETTPAEPVGLLLEIMKEGNLAEYIANCLDNEEIKLNTLACDVAKGLEHLHGLRIIHRDLRPDNILLFGGRTHAKICDFGLAKRQRERGERHTVEVGNLLFAAPDQWISPLYNRKVDVYSFSLCVYFLFYSKKPFETGDFPHGWFSVETARKLNRKNPPRPPLQGKRIDSLLERCWSRRMADRPTIREVVDILGNRELFPRLD